MTDREHRVVAHVDRDPVEQYGKQVLAEIEEERALALAALEAGVVPMTVHGTSFWASKFIQRGSGMVPHEQRICEHFPTALKALAAAGERLGLQPVRVLTLEMVEKAVRDELSEKLVFLAGGILRDDVVDVAVNGVMERLRQQMGGGNPARLA